jgi:hypothetical protein
MPSILELLGLDPAEVEWQDLALCNGMEPEWWHDDYAEDQKLAKEVDEICLRCPVRKSCLQQGIENNEWGNWGGVYLKEGEVDTKKNEHKTEEVWSRIRQTIEQ